MAWAVAILGCGYTSTFLTGSYLVPRYFIFYSLNKGTIERKLSNVNIYLMFAINIALSIITALTLAKKKRIGIEWGIFFCMFFSVIVGGICISYSPALTNLKEPKITDKSGDKITGFVSLFIAFIFFYAAAQAFDNELLFMDLIGIIAFIGLAVYAFQRYNRNLKMYKATTIPIIYEEKEIHKEIVTTETIASSKNIDTKIFFTICIIFILGLFVNRVDPIKDWIEWLLAIGLILTTWSLKLF